MRLLLSLTVDEHAPAKRRWFLRLFAGMSVALFVGSYLLDLEVQQSGRTTSPPWFAILAAALAWAFGVSYALLMASIVSIQRIQRERSIERQLTGSGKQVVSLYLSQGVRDFLVAMGIARSLSKYQVVISFSFDDSGLQIWQGVSHAVPIGGVPWQRLSTITTRHDPHGVAYLRLSLVEPKDCSVDAMVAVGLLGMRFRDLDRLAAAVESARNSK